MPANKNAEQPGQQKGLGQGQFLTVAEVARRLKLSKMTVYRFIHSGELPAVRLGRSFRVPERAVDEMLERAFYSAG